MIQGTMSGVGKSAITAGLCRIFKQDGFTPAPFKSQNMALNSFVTKDGLEMGRAQVMQAYAAGIEPQVLMNPILLKPTDDKASQVIVKGRPAGNMSAAEYYTRKKSLIPVIKEAYDTLLGSYSPIIIEGAGSPAEINLKQNDIVNMGLAAMLDAPVLLVGDIDRGGVFAQLVGTLELLDADERKRVKGLVINKFRGDKSLLQDGIRMLEGRTGVPVLGIIPYIHDLNLEDEDSLSDRLMGHRLRDSSLDDNEDASNIMISVIRLPHISNFTDFDIFEQIPGVTLIYTADPGILERSDLIMIPGSKNTIADMEFLRNKNISDTLCKLHGKVPIFGICGGLQILGGTISDPDSVESGGSISGLGLLPINTVLSTDKRTLRTEGVLNDDISGIFSTLSGLCYSGYEIHAGVSFPDNPGSPHAVSEEIPSLPPVISTDSSVYGTYIHGIFDSAKTAGALIGALSKKKGIDTDLSLLLDEKDFREDQYDTLAEVIRSNTDIGAIRELFCSSPSRH